MMTSLVNTDIIEPTRTTVVPEQLLTSVFQWREQVTVTTQGTDLLVVNLGTTTKLRNIPESIRLHLMDPGTTDMPQGRAYELSQQLLERLGHLSATCLGYQGNEVMRHERTMRGALYEPASLSGADSVRLDRFAFLRNRGQHLVFECPRTRHRFILSSELARTLAVNLGTPRLVEDLAGEAPLYSLVVKEILEHWVGAGLVERANSDGTFATDTDPVLVQWDFHDLLMHSRSRSGRYDDPLGALSPYRGRIEALAATVAPPPKTTIVIGLPQPVAWTNGLSLSEVIQQRRSMRDYSEDPISLDQLSTFLHRAFRDRARFDPPPSSELESKVSRPYPSGGGLYEHELYLTVRRCTGLGPGIYHYDALGHQLELITREQGAANEMLAVATAATGETGRPDILFTLTARFQRMSWRYRSIAYANILRTTGAIYQTMYLVATDLDLASCALGNGDADLSSRVLGLDYLQESSVGDFILGRRDPSDTVTGAPLSGWTVFDNPTDTQ